MYAVRVGGAAAPRSPGAHQHHRRKREEPMIEGRVEQKKTKTLHTHFAFHRLPLWRRPSLNAGVRTRLGVMSLLCGFASKSEACAASASASVRPGIPGPPRCQSGVACLVLGSILNKEGHSAGSAAYRMVCVLKNAVARVLVARVGRVKAGGHVVNLRPSHWLAQARTFCRITCVVLMGNRNHTTPQ